MLKTVNFKYQISNSKLFIYNLCSVFFILLFINFAYAQEDTAVTTVEPQAEVATSPDIQPDAGTTESVTSDAEPEIISDSNLKPAQISSEGNSGAAITSIPIIVTPGRKGIQPNISLTYNSNSGNGWLGVGWSLDMGAIQRNTKNLDYGANDYVAVFNGSVSELVQRGITNYYDHKIEGEFSKYQKTASGWIVTKKDGTKYYYGQNSLSRQDDPSDPTRIFKWCLDRVEDKNGNYMTITYGKDYPANGEIYLEGIDYTGNGSFPTSNHVRFYRESRTDVPLMYTTNFSVITANRLKTIDVLYGSSRVRTYKFSYATSSVTSRSLLFSVQQYGSDAVLDGSQSVIGGTALPAINFNYFGGTPQFTVSASGPGWSDASGWDQPKYYSTIRFADIDGDGKADVCGRGGSGIKCYLSTGSGFATTSIDGPGWSDASGWDQPKYYLTIRFADINGDGKADVCGRGTSRIKCYLSTGSGFPTTSIDGPTWSDANGWDVGNRFKTIQFADINGDGKADVCGRSGSGIKCYLSTGSGFSTLVDGPNWSDANGWDVANHFLTIRFTDINGDGKADVCGRGTSGIKCYLSTGSGFTTTSIDGPNWSDADGWDVPMYYSTIQFADINEDGKADACGRGANGVKCYLSKGSGFTTTSIDGPNWSDAEGWDQSMYYSTIRFADINGDAKADVCGRSGSGIICYLSTGNGFPTLVNGPLWSDADGWDQSMYYPTIRFADIDGDGKTDVCGRSSTGIICQKPTEDGIESIRSISNGVGGTTTLQFKPSSVYDNCLDIDGKNTCLPFVMQTLSTVTENDGNGNSSIKNYTYTGGYFDYAEREFRGFQNVNSRDCLTHQNNICSPDPDGKQTESWYYQYQDNIFKGLPYEQLTKDQDNYIYTRTLNTYESKQPPTNASVNFPYLKQQDSYVFDGITQDKEALSEAWHTRISYEYNDDYGNVTSKSYEDLTYNRGDKKTEYTAYFYDTTNYIVSLPSTKYVRDKDGNTKTQDWFTYYYGTTNLHTKESWLQGGTNPVTTYAYDEEGYGNLWKTFDPNNNEPTIITYDTVTHTFPEVITNPKGHVIRKTYDTVFVDKVRTETDANSKDTTYDYDTFGRLQKITRPQPYGITVYSYPDLNTLGNQFGTMTQHIRKEEKDLSLTLIQWKETYFDGLERTVSQKRGGPNVTDVITDTQYNRHGLVWKKSNPYFSGAVNIYNAENSYDSMGRLVYMLNPDATEKSIGYMQGTNTYIDANYHKKEELKDMYGRTIVINEYTGTGTAPSPYVPYATTTYWYDVLNNLETVVDAKLNQTDISYDTLSRKTFMHDPDMGHWEYQYDLNGNLTYQEDAKNQKIYFQYDELNRLRQKDYGTQKTLGSGDIVYTYDQGSSSINPVGRLTTLTDNNSVTIDTYAYDPMGKVKETGKTINSQTYTTKTGYDAIGMVETVTYPDNTVVKYTHDALDNLIQVKDPSNSPVYAAYINYNAKGQYGTVTYANGVSTTYQYRAENNRLTSILTYSPTVGNLINLAYDQYDNAGNIKRITDSITYPGGISRTRSYVYDDLDRLIEADSPSYSGKLLYQYDKIGNMTYNCINGYYFYDDSDHIHAVTSIKKTDGTWVASYSYDPNGNMYAGAGRGLTYDYDNRPTRIDYGSTYVESKYDANGQRVKKVTPSSTTVYIGQTYECTGTQCTKYIISGTKIVAQISAAGTYYYHSDHLGSSSIITNASGNKAEDIFYYPYGDRNVESGSISVKYKFTGKELDSEDGLYYYGARYYDPKLARFISADTIVPMPFYPISLNRYAYAYNNPIVLKDLDGHITYNWEYPNNNYCSYCALNSYQSSSYQFSMYNPTTNTFSVTNYQSSMYNFSSNTYPVSNYMFGSSYSSSTSSSTYMGNYTSNYVDTLGSEQIVIGVRGGLPMVSNTQTGTYTLGYPDSYVDPFSDAIGSLGKDAASFAVTLYTNDFVQPLIEMTAEKYIGGAAAISMRTFNALMMVFDPDPSTVYAPTCEGDW